MTSAEKIRERKAELEKNVKKNKVEHKKFQKFLCSSEQLFPHLSNHRVLVF
jgi:hypothetical protein